MIDTGEYEEFEQKVLSLPVVGNIVAEVAQNLMTESHDHQLRVRGVPFGNDSIFVILQLSLFLLTKVGIDHLRKMSDLASAKKLIDLVNEMTKHGFSRKQSTQAMERLLRLVRSPSLDNELLRILLAWTGSHQARNPPDTLED